VIKFFRKADKWWWQWMAMTPIGPFPTKLAAKNDYAATVLGGAK
jgi:hypothetical protein